MLSGLIVDLSDFEIIQTIIEDQFSCVFLVENKKTKNKYAAKVSKTNSNWTNEQSTFLYEIETFIKTKFPSILQLIGFNLSDFNNQPNPTIITEFLQNGSLNKILDKERDSSAPDEWNNTAKYINLLGICLGMKYLHSINIIHGDLNPTSILLDDQYYPQINNFALSIKKKVEIHKILASSTQGTPIYIAPEIINNQDYNEKADVYSFSLILYEIITKNPPILPLDISKLPGEENQEFLSRCLSQDPSKRPSFEEIFDFIQTENFKKKFSDLNEESVTKYLHKFEVHTFNESELQNEDSEKVYNIGLNYFFGDEGYQVDKKKAFICFKISSEKGNSNAMFNYGRMLETGDGVEENKREASQYYKMSADKGNIKAMFNYGLMLVKGEAVEVNKKEACRYYKMASDQGYVKAMFNLARLLESDEDVETNKEEATRLFKTAADKGNIKAMANYARIQFDQNKEESARYYKMAADNGNVNSMFEYSLMVYKGEGIQQNKEEAVNLLKLAADKGSIKAMNFYGQILSKGEFVNQNKEEAARYYKMAADNGNINSMFEYALMVSKGEGIQQNKKEASIYYKKAADKGNLGAMNNYGLMLAKGDGVEANKNEALKYFKKAAEKGNVSSMINYCWLIDEDKTQNQNQIENDNKNSLAELNHYLRLVAQKGNSSLLNEFGKKLYKGDGVEMNKRKSALFFKVGADYGNIDAMNNYGSMLYNGEGVKANKKEANYYFKIAANKGNPDAMYHYSQALMKGDGIAENKVEAICYLKMAADKGNPESMFEYGMMLLHGNDGVVLNKKEAAKYLKESADKGNINAMVNYGLMLSNGDGIQANQEEANKYFKMIENK